MVLSLFCQALSCHSLVIIWSGHCHGLVTVLSCSGPGLVMSCHGLVMVLLGVPLKSPPFNFLSTRSHVNRLQISQVPEVTQGFCTQRGGGPLQRDTLYHVVVRHCLVHNTVFFGLVRALCCHGLVTVILILQDGQLKNQTGYAPLITDSPPTSSTTFP